MTNESFVCLLLFAGVFLLHHALFSSKKITLEKRHFVDLSAYFKHPVILSRLTAIPIFFIIPIVITRLFFDEALQGYGLSGKNFLQSLSWSAVVGAGLIVMNIIWGKRPENLARYPQIREKKWDLPLLILSAAAWIGYIFAYEYLFRGLLLFSCYRAWGFWNAVSLNVTLYTMAHLDKSLAELVGAVPLGFLLAILTLKTGTIWAAFFIHATLALSNEWLALHYSPETEVRWKI